MYIKRKKKTPGVIFTSLISSFIFVFFSDVIQRDSCILTMVILLSLVSSTSSYVTRESPGLKSM